MKKIITKQKIQSEDIDNSKPLKRLLLLSISCTILTVLIVIIQKHFLIGYSEYTKFINVIIVIIVLLMVWQAIDLIMRTFFSNLIYNSVIRVINMFAKNKKMISSIEEVNATEKMKIETNLLKPLEYNITTQAEKIENEIRLTIEEVTEYTKEVLSTYIEEKEMERLCSYIVLYDETTEDSQISKIKSTIKLESNDILNYGWNIGKVLNKNKHFENRKREQTAIFLKKVFAVELGGFTIKSIVGNLDKYNKNRESRIINYNDYKKSIKQSNINKQSIL